MSSRQYGKFLLHITRLYHTSLPWEAGPGVLVGKRDVDEPWGSPNEQLNVSVYIYIVVVVVDFLNLWPGSRVSIVLKMLLAMDNHHYQSSPQFTYMCFEVHASVLNSISSG